MRQKKTIVEDENESKNEIEPFETNNTISLKTKNLKKALQNLDLITETEIKNFNNKQIKNRNIIKSKSIKKFSKTIKNDYDEVNKFTQTLLVDMAWGRINEMSKKPIMQTIRLPKKPENKELIREVSSNLVHLPRKRLPPISGAVKLFDDDQSKINSTRLKENKTKSKHKSGSKVEIDSINKNYLQTISAFHKRK